MHMQLDVTVEIVFSDHVLHFNVVSTVLCGRETGAKQHPFLQKYTRVGVYLAKQIVLD